MAKSILNKSLYAGSDEYFEYSCDPCKNSGDFLEAHGFCVKCGEYLCGTCYWSHARGKATRDHALLDKQNMPKRAPRVCDLCKTAGLEKAAEGFCRECDEFLCNNCSRSHSRSKATKHHYILGKDEMPSALTTVMARMGIGKGDDRASKENVSFEGDIKTKTFGDGKLCLINGMALLSDTELLITDFQNMCVKLVDIPNNMIKEKLKFQTEPRGITAISTDQTAVTLKGTRIEIVSKKPRLTVVKSLKTDSQPDAIQCKNGRLYVSFYKPVPKIQVLHLSGAASRTIRLHGGVEVKFLTVSNDETKIYFTNDKTVVCINMNGDMLYTYNLNDPEGIVISPSVGHVYVCCLWDSVIYRLSPDLRNADVLLQKSDGLPVGPLALCFNAEKDQLYVSSGAEEEHQCNYIKVFQWK